MGGRGSGSGLQGAGQRVKPTLEDLIGPKGTPKTIGEAIALANPHYQESVKNGDMLYSYNCQRCIWAVELLRRGYDVEALPHTPDDVYVPQYLDVSKPPLDFYHWVGNAYYPAKAIDVERAIRHHPEGARGVLLFEWRKNGEANVHVMNWEIVKGKVVFYDGQSNDIYTAAQLVKDFGGYAFSANRIDDRDINTELISKFVKKKG